MWLDRLDLLPGGESLAPSHDGISSRAGGAKSWKEGEAHA
jgi:hypothetical protein